MCCVPVYNLVYIYAFVSGHIFCTSYVATYVVLAFNSWKYNAKFSLKKKADMVHYHRRHQQARLA